MFVMVVFICRELIVFEIIDEMLMVIVFVLKSVFVWLVNCVCWVFKLSVI